MASRFYRQRYYIFFNNNMNFLDKDPSENRTKITKH